MVYNLTESNKSNIQHTSTKIFMLKNFMSYPKIHPPTGDNYNILTRLFTMMSQPNSVEVDEHPHKIVFEQYEK